MKIYSPIFKTLLLANAVVVGFDISEMQKPGATVDLKAYCLYILIPFASSFAFLVWPFAGGVSSRPVKPIDKVGRELSRLASFCALRGDPEGMAIVAKLAEYAKKLTPVVVLLLASGCVYRANVSPSPAPPSGSDPIRVAAAQGSVDAIRRYAQVYREAKQQPFANRKAAYDWIESRAKSERVAAFKPLTDGLRDNLGVDDTQPFDLAKFQTIAEQAALGFEDAAGAK